MKALTKILAGTAGLTALVGLATPAAAQYYPSPYGYGQGSNVVGQIISNVLGYGRYPYGNYGYGQQGYMNSQAAINQCARATEQRINGYAYNGYGNQYGYGNGYGYNNYAVNGQGRVLGIDRVERKSNGRIKVYGVASSGRSYAQPWGYGQYAYNQSYGVPDLKFNCKIDGSGRIYEINVDRNDGRGYGNNGYYNNGYNGGYYGTGGGYVRY